MLLSRNSRILTMCNKDHWQNVCWWLWSEDYSTVLNSLMLSSQLAVERLRIVSHSTSIYIPSHSSWVDSGVSDLWWSQWETSHVFFAWIAKIWFTRPSMFSVKKNLQYFCVWSITFDKNYQKLFFTRKTLGKDIKFLDTL